MFTVELYDSPCGWRDLNPQALRRLILSQLRLPFRHTRSEQNHYLHSGYHPAIPAMMSRVTRLVILFLVGFADSNRISPTIGSVLDYSQ